MDGPTHASVPFFHVSSFTDAAEELLGNPAGVVLLSDSWPSAAPPTVYLRAAGELNLSETCFVTPQPPGAPAAAATDFALRWFSPAKEVALCGHGTLAAAHALAALGNAQPLLTFHTLSGPLQVRAAGSARAAPPAVTQATMSFPANPPAPLDAAGAPMAELARLVLGEHLPLLASCHYSARARKAVLVLAPGAASAAALAALRPAATALLALRQPEDPSARVEGVSVACARPDQGPAHFCCRYWSPWNGLPGAGGEDPVNGSSHTLLAPLFEQLLCLPPGTEMQSTHLSPRGGRLHVAVLPGDRVSIRGQATTVCQGHMWIQL